MGTWKVPYSIPRFTTEEFEKMKAEYVEKHGYEVYLPGWEDVVHFALEKPITDTEEVRWAAKDWNWFTPTRLEELRSIKEKRRRQYLRFLGSPQPHIFRNRGSLLVAIDNTQDTLSTLSMIIRISITAMPLVFSRLLIGPVGWIMTGADILNLMTHVMTPERSAIKIKRITDSITGKNPFSKKARLARMKKALSGKIGVGTVVEALQTTDQAFGVGISLGAIMNLPFDMFFGNVQYLNGKPVKIVPPVAEHSFWERQAGLAWKSLTMLFTTEHIFDIAESLPMMVLSHMTAIAMHVITPTLDPKNQIGDVSQYLVKALEPTKSYLKEIIEEAGDNIENVTGWPLTGTKYASCTEISQKGHSIASEVFKNECYRSRYRLEGLYSAMRATEASLFMFETISEPGSVQTDHTATCKTIHALLNAGYRLPYYLTRPSGWWSKEENIPYDDFDNDIKNTVDNKLKFYLDTYGQLEWRDFQRFDESLFWHDFPKSRVYESYQYLKYFEPENLPRASLQPEGTLANAITERLNNYLDDHERNGSTPTTPGIIRFLKDNYGIKIPVNDTVEAPLVPPEIPLPTEIPPA